MNCQEARRSLPHYLNDELSASERELMQAHLAECEACFGELQTLSQMQRQIRSGLHVATERVEPSMQAWTKLRTVIQSEQKPQPAPQYRPVFFLRAIGAVFATLSVMVGAAVLRPALLGNLAPASEAGAPVSTQSAQSSLARAPYPAANPDRKQLAAFLKSEPYQSVRSAIEILSEPDLYALDEFICPTCTRMQ